MADATNPRRAAITSLHSSRLPAAASDLDVAKSCATQTCCAGWARGWEPAPTADAPLDQAIAWTGVFRWRGKEVFDKVRGKQSFGGATQGYAPPPDRGSRKIPSWLNCIRSHSD
ncbi:hypothetical protein CLCR_10944 [Cladophialophora carrionii]|uniref:Uncharacterized protein n=1 Tax=Cladophialophora carrionii TaxID=86049 RepID=A0A1C1CYG3_9EURO|nr:hypothetical protein CLCR_10944 [Cladophialophora carrionii]